MIQLISGIIASTLHVLTGPDHLAAVTPLAIESKKKSWSVGLFWGLGHIAGMVLIGVLFILFKEYIPIEAISEHSEQIVGIVLIGIGVWAIVKVFIKKTPAHKHPHYHTKPEPHVHIHAHPHEANHDHEHPHSHTHKHDKTVKQNNIAAFGVGTLHGFAGVSHLILLLPTLALDIHDGILYLTGFAGGTIATMVIYAAIWGYVGQRSATMRNHKIFMIVRIVGGLIAIGIGIYWFFSTI